MTADPRDKIDPEKLELRAKPRPITRISRKVLYTGSALLLLFISGAVLIALDPPDWKDGKRTELIEAGRSQTPEGIERLPSSYDRIPKLGPPNPGDLGKSITQLERDLNIQPRPLPSFKSDPEEEFKRAERIRLAKLAAEANASGVFFTIQARQFSTEETSNPPDSANAGAKIDPLAAFEALNRPPTSAATAGPNEQDGKVAFLENGPDGKIYNEHSVQEPVSPYQLMAGTVIAASLITGLNSDLPGTVIAQVTEHTYDTVTGEHLLIPQGSRLIGRYDSNISFGQNRALVVWQRIIRPDGTSIVIDNLPGTDPAGFAGVADRVDFHTRQLVKSIGLATLLGVGTELSFGSNESELVRALRESIQENTNRTGQRIVDRTLDVQPTITVRPGWPVRVIVHRDIVLPPTNLGVH
jgi:type IV secretion system protein VirB10